MYAIGARGRVEVPQDSQAESLCVAGTTTALSVAPYGAGGSPRFRLTVAPFTDPRSAARVPKRALTSR